MSWRRWLSTAGAALAAMAACAAGGPAMAGPVADWQQPAAKAWNEAQKAARKHLSKGKRPAAGPKKRADGMLRIQPYRPNRSMTIRDLARHHWRFPREKRR